ncbi:hypothetical protein M514_02552 [Trichuris suis]|uniref:5'-nucleotidase n=1 Tax=Trichuris suis TaxID=68888 RepID=A0A085MGV2_9BILA|nr:hypothetical protein M513_02552 [Trichuris suis]KFD70976.1 hypothetical protein M514_02552 [Trichuris suis]KHJ48558.1 HAD hydrolase, family IE [Trichuris suis]
MCDSAVLDKVKKTISDLQERQFIFIRDVAGLQTKFERLCDETTSAVQVVSDFDFTISKYVNSTGERLWTTHDVFDQGIRVIKMELYEEVRALRAKYLPIEFSTEMTIEEKIPHMETWWRLAHACIVRAGFSRADLKTLASVARIELRNGFTEFLSWSEKNGIPVTVFSAGIANIIRELFNHRVGRVPLNMRVIGNEFSFDEFGTVCGFFEPLIHTYNKNISAIKCRDDFMGSLKDRRNIVLFGDTLGDARMDLGIGETERILKIGFLNHTVDGMKESYMRAYDVVISDPTDFNMASELLFSLLGR